MYLTVIGLQISRKRGQIERHRLVRCNLRGVFLIWRLPDLVDLVAWDELGLDMVAISVTSFSFCCGLNGRFLLLVVLGVLRGCRHGRCDSGAILVACGGLGQGCTDLQAGRGVEARLLKSLVLMRGHSARVRLIENSFIFLLAGGGWG